MLKHVLMSGRSAQHLINAIAQISFQDTIRVFSGIIRIWLEWIVMQEKVDRVSEITTATSFTTSQSDSGGVPLPIDTDRSFFGREMKRLLQKVLYVDSAAHNVIQFFIETAHRNMTLRRGLLEAGALSLVLATFTNIGFQFSGLIDNFEITKRRRKKGQTEKSYADWSLERLSCSPIPLDVIHADAAMLTVWMQYPSFREAWSAEQLTMRWALCSSLVNSLLGDLRDIDEKYVWTRALFTKILA